MSILLNLFEELVKSLPTVLLALRYVARHEGYTDDPLPVAGCEKIPHIK